MHRALDWATATGQRIRIYRNLNNGRMSMQLKVDRRWLVMGHETDCVIRDVAFHVSEGGRQRVIREGCKNVHAWGEGILVAQFDADIYAPIRLGYNPYIHAAFVDLDDESTIMQSGRYLVVRGNQVFVAPNKIVHSPIVTQPQTAKGFQQSLFCAA